MPNRLKEIWAAGRPSLNGWVSIGNGFVAEIMAGAGYDSLTVDVQHGALAYTDALAILQAMRASGVVPLARVPWCEPGIVMKMLDAGALGIICPMVGSAEMAAEFVSYCRYPPHGQRSFGPTRAVVAHGPDYYATANDSVLTFAMIETADGMKNLEAIAATPGLDGIYVGPADLTLGMTEGRLKPGFDREEAEMVAHLKRIAEVCRETGIKAALHCGTADYAARAIGWGYNMTTILGDARLLAAAAGRSVAEFREATGTGATRATEGGSY